MPSAVLRIPSNNAAPRGLPRELIHEVIAELVASYIDQAIFPCPLARSSTEESQGSLSPHRPSSSSQGNTETNDFPRALKIPPVYAATEEDFSEITSREILLDEDEDEEYDEYDDEDEDEEGSPLRDILASEVREPRNQLQEPIPPNYWASLFLASRYFYIMTREVLISACGKNFPTDGFIPVSTIMRSFNSTLVKLRKHHFCSRIPSIPYGVNNNCSQLKLPCTKLIEAYLLSFSADRLTLDYAWRGPHYEAEEEVAMLPSWTTYGTVARRAVIRMKLAHDRFHHVCDLIEDSSNLANRFYALKHEFNDLEEPEIKDYILALSSALSQFEVVERRLIKEEKEKAGYPCVASDTIEHLKLIPFFESLTNVQGTKTLDDISTRAQLLLDNWKLRAEQPVYDEVF